MKIVIVGAQGQLGAALVHELGKTHDVVALGHADLELTDDLAVDAAIARHAPDAVVNAAAYNDVDGAEDHAVAALNTNAIAVRALARAAGALGVTFVHYSTDFVFDGRGHVPYAESDRPNPQGVYATSKLLGEWFALDSPSAYVLRVESLFGRAPNARPPHGTVAAMVRAMREGREVRAFADRTVSPTYVIDAAAITRRLLETKAPTGLYHLVNSGYCTWLEFAREMARLLPGDAPIVPIRMDQMSLRAARPKFCALSNVKLVSLGFTLPTWDAALAAYLQSEAGSVKVG
jgi:dTDP-4-dehydrorhamnose reductase